jgi:hypothetical protein
MTSKHNFCLTGEPSQYLVTPVNKCFFDKDCTLKTAPEINSDFGYENHLTIPN